MDSQLNTDVWTYELQRQSSKRLTFDPAFDVAPIWNPDGSRLVFASNRRLNVDLYIKDSDGAQEEKVLYMTSSTSFRTTGSEMENTSFTAETRICGS